MDIAEIRRKAKALKDMAEEPGTVEKEPPPAMPDMPAEGAHETLTPDAAAGEMLSGADSEPVSSIAAVTPLQPEAAEAEIEAITFLLDNEEYAIDIHQVKEVIKTREMTEVPGAPKDIIGVISLRGVVVPVMDLRGRLGMPMKEGGERIVIVRDGPDLLGLLVDSVRQVVRISEDGIEPPPVVNTIGGEFIRGIGRCKGAMFILLDMEKILERM